MSKTEVKYNMEKVQEKQGSLVSLESQLYSYAEEPVNDISSDIIALPYLNILQAMSPQVQGDKPEYVGGAKPGMIFNNVTKEVFDGKQGVLVVPCAVDHYIAEWRPRDLGGGKIGQYAPSDAAAKPVGVDSKGKPINAAGNNLEETISYWIIRVTEGGAGFEHAVVSMKSTQLKKAKRWNYMLKGYMLKGPNGLRPAPLFSRIFKLTTVSETNKHGSYYNWEVEPVKQVDDAELLSLAHSFRTVVRSGQVKMSEAELDADVTISAEELPF